MIARLALLLAIAAAPAQAQVIAYEAGSHRAAPALAAEARGWGGARPVMAAFPSLQAQLSALAARSWDIGIASASLTLSGAARHELMVIAISGDDSEREGLGARPGEAAAMRAWPAGIGPGIVFSAPVSIGDYVTATCLRRLGLADMMTVIGGTTERLRERFRAREGRMIQLSLLPGEVEPVCTAREMNLNLPVAVVARRAWLEENAALAARIVAALISAGIPNVAEQRRLLARGGPVRGWYGALREHYQRTQVFGPIPDPILFVTDDVVSRLP